MEFYHLPTRNCIYEDRGTDPLLELQRGKEPRFPPRNEGVGSKIQPSSTDPLGTQDQRRVDNESMQAVDENALDPI